MAYCNNLSEALLCRNVDLVRHYLDAGILEQTDNKRWEILLEAIKSGNEIILDLVSKKIDITICDSRRVTALHLATCFGHPNIVDYLLGLQKFNVNDADTNGMTALHWACFWGKSDIAWKLIQAGADFRIVNRAGNTPRMLAEERDQQHVAKQMLAYENYIKEAKQTQQCPIEEEEMVSSEQEPSPAGNNVDNASSILADSASMCLEIDDIIVTGEQLSSISRSNEKEYFEAQFSSMKSQLVDIKLMVTNQMKVLHDLQEQVKHKTIKQNCTFHQIGDENVGKCSHLCCCSTALMQLTEARKCYTEMINRPEHKELLQQVYNLLAIEKQDLSTRHCRSVINQEMTTIQPNAESGRYLESGGRNFTAHEILKTSAPLFRAAATTDHIKTNAPVLSQKLFCKLSRQLGNDIYALGTYLNLDTSEIQNIYDRFGLNMANFHFNILHRWWQKQGGPSCSPLCAFALADALRDIDREDLCRLVEANTE